VRRKLYDVYRATDSPIAREALKRIGALYHTEEQIRSHSPEERQAVLEALVGPMLDSLHQYRSVGTLIPQLNLHVRVFTRIAPAHP
jgi:Transposase IS66 family